MGLDLIIYWKTQLSKGYFAEFENVFICLMTYIFATRFIQNLFQKLNSEI